MNITIENKDILQWADEYTGLPFHAIICDPPYELGFMGKKWDSSGVAFQKETWASISRHLHPGGFGMAFASTRGFHRMAVAIEDAGLTIHPVIMAYGFGSGFPKATRIDRKVDKDLGLEQEVIEVEDRYNVPSGIVDAGRNKRVRIQRKITRATSEKAKQWEGHRYGLQALKPALEPVIVFQKSYDGKPVDSIVKTGAGAINVDGGRVGTEARWNKSAGNKNLDNRYTVTPISKHSEVEGRECIGRWPANLILTYPEDRKDEVVGAFPGNVRGAVPGTQKKQGQSGSTGGVTYSSDKFGYQKISGFKEEVGSAARFFYNAVHEQIDEADPLYYTAKPSRRERDAGTEGSEQIKQCMTPRAAGQTVLEIMRGNIHPTVKPINLIKYLTTLLLPPVEYAPRRIMVPFAGSGSEMIGAMLAGWEDVVGIERESEYVEIARKRIEHWKSKEESMLF
jgi:site-specific DNA-methyltransferase (adenine-specific)